MTENMKNKGESHRSFSSGNRHNKERKNVSIKVNAVLRKRDKRQVYRVQHQLHTHEECDGVSFDQNAVNADAKCDGANEQIMGERDFHDSTSETLLGDDDCTNDGAQKEKSGELEWDDKTIHEQKAHRLNGSEIS